MNGRNQISSREQLTPLQRKKRDEKNQLIKLLLCLLLSNIFVYILTNKKGPPIQEKQEIPKDHISMELPLKLYIQLKEGRSKKVDLVDPKTKKTVLTCLIFEKLENSSEGPENTSRFRIVISKNEISKIINYRGGILLAYPPFSNKERTSKLVHAKEGGPYEIAF